MLLFEAPNAASKSQVAIYTFHSGKLILSKLESMRYISFHTGKLKRKIMMHKQTNDISINEAKEALDSIAAANRVAFESVSPPFWLRIMLALLIGALTIFSAWSSGSGLWTLVMLVTLVLIMLTFVSFYWVLCSKGIKLLINPNNTTDKVISLVGSFVSACLLMISIELYRNGYTWVPYVAAVFNFTLVLYLMHKYSINGVPMQRGN